MYIIIFSNTRKKGNLHVPIKLNGQSNFFIAGLLMFCAVTQSRISSKSAKSRKTQKINPLLNHPSKI